MIILVVFYLILFLFGIQFNWLVNPYDELRILQLLLVSLCSLNYICLNNNKNVSLKKIIIPILILIVICINHENIFSIYDLILWLNCFILLSILKESDIYANLNISILALLILCTLLAHFLIFLWVYDFVFNGKIYSWHINYSSIRILNSVVIPIFWLAFFLVSKHKIIKKSYPFLVYFIVLGLLIDGARSAFISLFIPLLLLLFMSKKYRIDALKTCIWLGLAFISYQIILSLYNALHDTSQSLNIARYTSSSRIELWIFMYEQWLKNPLIGTGGGYLAEIHYPIGYHMHNLYLRLIFEWGVLGSVILLWLWCEFFNLMKSKVDIILKMGVLAIAIDAVFSGNFIYPAAQVTCILFIAIAYSELNKIERVAQYNFKIKQKYLSISLFIIYIALISFYIGSDMLCIGCSSLEGRAAPFFWEHGGSKKLEIVD